MLIRNKGIAISCSYEKATIEKLLDMIHFDISQGGQKLRTGILVLPVADNMFCLLLGLKFEFT